jgi:hypothetical protein
MELIVAIFLKIVSGIYLILVWLTFFAVSANAPRELTSGMNAEAFRFVAFAATIGLSIPAAVLFAFGQIVGDVRFIRNQTSLKNRDTAAI